MMNPAEDVAADRLERGWFAAFRAASAARAECEALLEEMERIEISWNHARVRLAEIEAIRDALGEEVMLLEGQPPAATLFATRVAVRAA
jgi:hypothetical protein